MERLRIATRGSRLSLIQTEKVVEALRRVAPRVEVEIVTVKTRGDQVTDVPLHKIGVKGIFEKEVNRAVLEGKADIAIHSLKDVPTQVHPRLVLAAVLPRDPPYDVLVSREGKYTIETLPPEAVVGTSSVRRAEMIRVERPDLKVKPLRGNVDTRIRKLRSGMYDAIVLAEAGILRLGENVEYVRIDPKTITPAPCQGIIGVYTLKDQHEILDVLKRIDHSETRIEAEAERLMLSLFGGGCHVPFGAYAEVVKDELKVLASAVNTQHRRKVTVEMWGDVEEWSKIAADAIEALKRGL